MKEKRQRTKKRNDKYNNSSCDNTMTFQECELAVLRQSVDTIEEEQGRRIVQNDDVKKILEIVEKFIVTKKLVCYGGTAINNILPKNAQFYDKSVDLPDYDFFSPNALENAKELADIYYKEGYTDVEAKAGVHMGTFKVFVNFIPIADITQLVDPLYKSIYKDSIMIAGIRYAPPDYLRMGMYLELSRPNGDISRWEKVFKRLTLLNTHYPMNSGNCHQIDLQRDLDSNKEQSEQLYTIARDTLIAQGVVFFGGYASSLYSKYTSKLEKQELKKIPDFDVITEDINRTAIILKEQLTREGFKNVKTVANKAIGEIIPESIEVLVGEETIAMLYSPIACHNYNILQIGNNKVNVATIDTILSFYLSFIYLDSIFHKERVLCMAKYLFDLEQKTRLNQRGLLKRFSMNCYGKQTTLEDMRSEKSDKFKELKNNRDSKEYEMWFLRYVPQSIFEKKQNKLLIKEKEKEKKRVSRIKSKTAKESDMSKSKRSTKKKNPIAKLFNKLRGSD